MTTFNKNRPFHVRQGDLLIRKISKIPDKIKTVEKKDRVVLEGEISGHNHEIVNGSVLLVAPGQSLSRDEQREAPYAFLHIPAKTELVHPEHNTIPLEAGEYEVIRQREVKGVVLD